METIKIILMAAFISWGMTFFSLAQVSSENMAAEQDGVTFRIAIDKAMFSEKAVLTVRVFNKEDLALSERMNGCTMKYNAKDKQEKAFCPEGVVYQKVEPEEFTFPVSGILEDLFVATKKLKVGEPYKISIFGLSHDNCNTASVSSQGIAGSRTLILKGLSWMETMLGCPSGRIN